MTSPSLSPVRRLLPFAMLLLLLTSCAKSGTPGGAGGFKMPPTPVETAPVLATRVRDQFRALGGIEAFETVQIVSEIDGIIRRLPFLEGRPAAHGALLAEIDDREIGADAKRADAQRDQAKANADRGHRLAEEQLISPQQLEDLGTALKVADANATIASARLAKTHIRAPFSGLVGRRRISPGAYVRAGTTITEMARVDEVRVNFSAPERYLAQLHPGIPVEVATPAFPGRVFKGTLQVVDPIIDPVSRTVQLVARVPNPGALLKPGMSADVAVTFSERPTALVVPDEAVFAEGSQSYVYVVKPDSTVTRTAIQLGTRDSMRVEVVHGLQPGQVVVRAGHQKLYEGAAVMPIGAPGAGGGKATK
jgi:membrane fusion protein, multidrug efflux system